MNNQILYVLLFWIGMPSIASAQKENIETVLQKLDSVVARHPENIQKKRAEINKFKRALGVTTGNYSRYEICNHLYHEYMKFDSDSALAYAYRGQELANEMKQKDLFVQSKINEMLIMAYRGEYTEVNDTMKEYGPIENIPSQFQCQYAVTCLEYYLRADLRTKNSLFISLQCCYG